MRGQRKPDGPRGVLHRQAPASVWPRTNRVRNINPRDRCTGSWIRTPGPRKSPPSRQASPWGNSSIWVCTWAAREVGSPKSPPIPTPLRPGIWGRAGAVQRALGRPARLHPSARAHAGVRARATWLPRRQRPCCPQGRPRPCAHAISCLRPGAASAPAEAPALRHRHPPRTWLTAAAAALPRHLVFRAREADSGASFLSSFFRPRPAR